MNLYDLALHAIIEWNTKWNFPTLLSEVTKFWFVNGAVRVTRVSSMCQNPADMHVHITATGEFGQLYEVTLYSTGNVVMEQTEKSSVVKKEFSAKESI